MSSDPAGGQKFWFNGVPYQGVDKPGTDTLGLKYWFNGVPVSTVIPAGSGAAAMPFSQVGSFRSPNFDLTTAPDQPYNLALYTATVAAALPFNQTDFAKPFFPRALELPTDPLNINPLTNPVPFAAAGIGAHRITALAPQDQPYNAALYAVNVVANPLPFNLDAPLVRHPLAAAPPPNGLNPNLQKNPVPFNQTDWEKRVRVPHITPDASVSLNPNLQKNNVPNNQTNWSKPFRVPSLPPDRSVSLNPNLQENPVPFNQTSWTPPRRVPDFLADNSASLNPNLVPAVVERPIVQTDQPRAANIPDFAPTPQQSLNPNLFANPVPFNQADWSKPTRLPHITPDASVAPNPNLPNPVPFNNELPRARAPRATPDLDPPYNAALYAVTVEALPFAATDQPLPMRLRGVIDPPQPLNLNLFGIFVPLNQFDFAVTSRPRASAAPPSLFNPNLSTNGMPFSQFHYPPARRVPAAPIELSRGQPNPNIFTNPMPFLQSDVAMVRPLRGARPFDTGNVALLGTPVAASTLPFNQYNFTPATKPQPQRRQDLLNPTLIASFVPPPPDAEQHSKPFFATPGRLMNI